MPAVLITPPAERPVTLAEAKAHLRVEGDHADAVLEELIDAAVGRLDGYAGILGRALVTQTWRVDLPAFPARDWVLPLAPVQAIESIVYRDIAGAEQVLPPAAYSLVSGPLGDGLAPAAFWPVAARQAVRMIFVAGYGGAAEVPAPIRRAILLIVESLYDRNPAAGALADQLVAPYRRLRI